MTLQYLTDTVPLSRLVLLAWFDTRFLIYSDLTLTKRIRFLNFICQFRVFQFKKLVLLKLIVKKITTIMQISKKCYKITNFLSMKISQWKNLAQVQKCFWRNVNNICISWKYNFESNLLLAWQCNKNRKLKFKVGTGNIVKVYPLTQALSSLRTSWSELGM